MPNTHSTLTSLFTDIADSIRAKTGENGLIIADDFPSAIDDIPTGGGGASEIESGVMFIDYDGSTVETWESSDVASKTALPNNPTHDRLVAQGWNWDLQHIKDYIDGNPDGLLYVGQYYLTVSGKNEIDIDVNKYTGKTVTLNLSGEKDWGDGTVDSSLEHTYSDYGEYTIKYGDAISMIPGTITSFIKRIFQTSSLRNNAYALASLETVTIAIYSSADQNNYAKNNCLKAAVLPKGCNSVSNDYFHICYSLAKISLPQTMTAISSGFANGCYSLRRIVIPPNVTSISNDAFKSCLSLKILDCTMCLTVPTLGTTAIGAPPDIRILVPARLYSDWISATNWSLYADRIYPIPPLDHVVALSITADNCIGNATTTTVHYTATWATSDGTEIDMTGDGISDPFPQNTSTTETVQRTVSFSYEGLTATTVITQGVYIEPSYTIEDVGTYPFTEISETIPNPDPTLYDGVYQSTNKGKDSSQSVAKITFKGYPNFTAYIRSYGESNYDYAIVSKIDASSYPASYDAATALVNTRGNAKSGTAITDYTKVEYPNDGAEHFVYVVFRKDGSSASGDDRGYFLIEK